MDRLTLFKEKINSLRFCGIKRFADDRTESIIHLFIPEGKALKTVLHLSREIDAWITLFVLSMMYPFVLVKISSKEEYLMFTFILIQIYKETFEYCWKVYYRRSKEMYDWRASRALFKIKVIDFIIQIISECYATNFLKIYFISFYYFNDEKELFPVLCS